MMDIKDITMLDIGLSSTRMYRVKSSDLATAWENDVPVLATPVLLWLTERVCMDAVDNHLNEGDFTVGYGHNSRHTAPTPEDWDVTINARLVAQEGIILTFDVEAFDQVDTVLKGQHTRAMLNKQKFLERFSRRSLTKG